VAIVAINSAGSRRHVRLASLAYVRYKMDLTIDITVADSAEVTLLVAPVRASGHLRGKDVRFFFAFADDVQFDLESAGAVAAVKCVPGLSPGSSGKSARNR
jgi:hypothetical protein